MTGYTEKSLRDYANEVGLKIVISQAHSDTVDTGMVISQTPAAGTQVKPGDTVNVSVSQGPDPEETKTWSKTISIPYQAPASSSTASASNSSGSGSTSSSSSAAPAPNGIQVFIADKTHNISTINRSFNITADDQITITLQVSTKYPGSYRIVRDGTVIAQEDNITQ